MIVAYDQARAIGRGNKLLWGRREMSNDIRNFRKLTIGSTIIMGRNTLQSIGIALPDRRSIVVTHNPSLIDVEGIDISGSVEDAIANAGNAGKVFIVGGGQIYEQALQYADKVHATEVHATIAGADTFFPELPVAEWSRSEPIHFKIDDTNIYEHDFVIYDRK
ncbi:MAG TPA: dihydrofolate reductase [Candidatus Microsaccharimonas sp.]